MDKIEFKNNHYALYFARGIEINPPQRIEGGGGYHKK